MTYVQKTDIVISLLRDEGIETEYCSPNLVAEFAANRGFHLTCDEVVQISNEYTLEETE